MRCGKSVLFFFLSSCAAESDSKCRVVAQEIIFPIFLFEAVEAQHPPLGNSFELNRAACELVAVSVLHYTNTFLKCQSPCRLFPIRLFSKKYIESSVIELRLLRITAYVFYNFKLLTLKRLQLACR